MYEEFDKDLIRARKELELKQEQKRRKARMEIKKNDWCTSLQLLKARFG